MDEWMDEWLPVGMRNTTQFMLNIWGFLHPYSLKLRKLLALSSPIFNPHPVSPLEEQ